MITIITTYYTNINQKINNYYNHNIQYKNIKIMLIIIIICNNYNKDKFLLVICQITKYKSCAHIIIKLILTFEESNIILSI